MHAFFFALLLVFPCVTFCQDITSPPVIFSITKVINETTVTTTTKQKEDAVLTQLPLANTTQSVNIDDIVDIFEFLQGHGQASIIAIVSVIILLTMASLVGFHLRHKHLRVLKNKNIQMALEMATKGK